MHAMFADLKFIKLLIPENSHLKLSVQVADALPTKLKVNLLCRLNLVDLSVSKKLKSKNQANKFLLVMFPELLR